MDDQDRCGAATRTGGRCRKVKGHGTTHLHVGRCDSHGGATPSHEKAARSEMARKLLEKYTEPVPVDPIAGVQDTLDRANGAMLATAGEMAEAVLDGQTGPVLEGLASRYMLALDRLQKFSVDATRLGIEDRRVVLEEKVAAIVVGVFLESLAELGLEGDVLVRARVVVAAKLRAIG